MSNNDNVQNRFDQSVSGTTPKINPDEQRKYLGTFRERVSLGIQIKDLSDNYAIECLLKEFNDNSDYQLILNGNVDHSLLSPFIKNASQNNIKFTIKNDSFYKNENDDYGAIYAAKSAINVNPINYKEKYPKQDINTKNKENPKNNSFFNKILKFFK
ncbi:YueI family protein [Apilactobacillus sp. TMW 2.2459]|uniref:YueI family protein n=1 Tax=Apilactobacillus xinyiensis TaxID=2841032 RepID=A0ABT0I048_9LACO|nr:YueI family protein [Apilactobacillus xinyiensis]MCK8623999.1 YueI family protein [Apilactobacillus xinyiensis]MCL0311591.1 YueI family protein [Apilactobacillus xinyiensis]